MTVNLTKTKMMVTGFGLGDADREPIVVGESEIGCVDEFPCLGSMVSSSGRMDVEVDRRIASASKAFGIPRHAVFTERNSILLPRGKSTKPVCYLYSFMGVSGGHLSAVT